MKRTDIRERFLDKLSVAANISRMLMVFGLFLIGYIWVDLYYGIQAERDLGLQSASKETANLARTFEEHTLRTIKSADQTAFVIKQQVESAAAPVNIAQYLKQGQPIGQPFVRLRVIDADGAILASSEASEKNFDSRYYEHFFVHRSVDSGQLFIGRPVWDPYSAKWAIPMTRRINKADGSFGGIVAVYVDPYYFGDLYKQIDLGKNSSIVLVGRDGIVRARQSDKNGAVGQNLTASEIMKQLETSDTGSYTAESTVDGVRRIYSYRSLADYPFVVLVGIAEDTVLHNINERILDNCRVAGMVTLATLGFIGLLLRASRRQQAAEKALKGAQADLERQVDARTLELSAANQQLSAMNGALETVNQELEEEIVERRRMEGELRKKTEEMWQVAYFDSLTGLPNRAYLLEWFTDELSAVEAEKTAGLLLFIDLDELKLINDSFGHVCGDAIIVMAGQRIKALVGQDDFIAHTGGDEFIVALPGSRTLAEIEALARQLMEVIRRKQQIDGTDFQVTASMGIARYPEDGDCVKELFKNADNAMYAAKRAGKNCWRMYAAAMQTEVYEKMVLTNSLREAISRNELEVHYQPQVNVESGRVSGFEALLRWNSIKYGMISPVKFIPLAEESGLIQSIGKWVMQEACRFAKRLEAAGYRDIYIAVNVSAQQLAEEDFVAMVQQVLQTAKISRHRLEIEITESVLLTSIENSIQKLRQLRDLGIKLSLDDFGVGYSSLTYLRRLPVDTLKIDKSFIDMIGVDGKGAEIIGAIIHMAHVLDKNVIAEGVETEKQRQYLAANHCDCIQGYFFSRPLPEGKAVKFLQKTSLATQAEELPADLLPDMK